MRIIALLAFFSCIHTATDAGPDAGASTVDAGPELTDVTTDIPLEGLIDDAGASALKEKLDGVEDGYPIIVHINTPGGDLDAALVMAQALERAAEHHAVTCIVDGQAASAGFYVLQSCQKRVMTRRSRLMAHEAYLPVLTNATAGAMQNALLEIRATIAMYVAQLAARSKMTRAQIAAKIRGGQEWWLDADVAPAAGFVDEVVDSPNARLK